MTSELEVRVDWKRSVVKAIPFFAILLFALISGWSVFSNAFLVDPAIREAPIGLLFILFISWGLFPAFCIAAIIGFVGHPLRFPVACVLTPRGVKFAQDERFADWAQIDWIWVAGRLRIKLRGDWFSTLISDGFFLETPLDDIEAYLRQHAPQGLVRPNAPSR